MNYFDYTIFLINFAVILGIIKYLRIYLKTQITSILSFRKSSQHRKVRTCSDLRHFDDLRCIGPAAEYTKKRDQSNFVKPKEWVDYAMVTVYNIYTYIVYNIYTYIVYLFLNLYNKSNENEDENNESSKPHEVKEGIENKDDEIGENKDDGIGENKDDEIGEKKDEEGGENKDDEIGENKDDEIGENKDEEGGENKDDEIGENKDEEGGENKDEEGGKNKDDEIGENKDEEGGESGYRFNPIMNMVFYVKSKVYTLIDYIINKYINTNRIENDLYVNQYSPVLPMMIDELSIEYTSTDLNDNCEPSILLENNKSAEYNTIFFFMENGRKNNSESQPVEYERGESKLESDGEKSKSDSHPVEDDRRESKSEDLEVDGVSVYFHRYNTCTTDSCPIYTNTETIISLGE